MIGDLRRRLMVLAMISAAGFVTSGNATATVVSGYFNQPANVALFASDGYGDLRAARFGNDDEIARNFAEYELTVLTPGSLTFTSTGYSKLGAQPYFSLFSGSGTGATFLDSNYSIPDIDFTLTRALAIGSYTFTLGVWVNQSFAENNPGANPTLGAGFTALGDPSLLGNSYYELSITSANGGVFQIAPVPEPSTLYMFIAGLLALGAARSFRRQRSEASRACLVDRHQLPNFEEVAAVKTWTSAQMGRFVILGAVFCVGTLLVVSEVKAQIRPAFTKNVDEPGRTPRSTLSQFFLQAGASGCYGGDCANYLGFGSTGAIFDLPPVPAGKRWIVVMATGGFVSGDGRVIEIQLQNSRGSLIFDSLKWIFGGPYSKSPSFAAATFSERMFATFEPGETPSLRVTTDGAIGFSTIALQGYLIDANN